MPSAPLIQRSRSLHPRPYHHSSLTNPHSINRSFNTENLQKCRKLHFFSFPIRRSIIFSIKFTPRVELEKIKYSFIVLFDEFDEISCLL
ncbi:hypothetical protein QVD17_31328 [Tagetes erecta]|uniref:Uncharacterized protein n=1 Tax=Tagetes erecta TaxID=13708 RepID=A0AAD8NGW8_TARER|nr:hypothetical protein QVD17_31328 [Tagetes erecta]